MKDKLSRHQQNQRANLIFKYVKNLGPYSKKQDQSLYDKLNSGRKVQKQQSLLLSSRVYQMSVGSSKSKKRVTFVQNEQNKVQNKMLSSNKLNLSHSKKQKIYPSMQTIKKNQNPEQISKELLILQKSIYNTFKIEDKQITQTSVSTLLSKVPLSQSNYQNRLLDLQLESKISAETQRKRASQSHIILKCQSQRSINTSKFQKNEKRAISSSKQSINNSEPSFSGISKINKKQFNNPQTSSQICINRSSSYSRQQNDLMVEIFRQKLQSKFNLSSTKHNRK